MAPPIRFSEKSLHHRKSSRRTRGALFGLLQHAKAQQDSVSRAYTVCNFGIRAADAGMVPTKPFFCRSLKGRTTPRRGRGGIDWPAAASLRRPYGKR
jgi:hypothetical protein